MSVHAQVKSQPLQGVDRELVNYPTLRAKNIHLADNALYAKFLAYVSVPLGFIPQFHFCINDNLRHTNDLSNR